MVSIDAIFVHGVSSDVPFPIDLLAVALRSARQPCCRHVCQRDSDMSFYRCAPGSIAGSRQVIKSVGFTSATPLMYIA